MQTSAAVQDGIRRYEHFAKVDPQNASLQVELSELYRSVGRFDEALACLDICLEQEPANKRARSRKGLVLIAQRRFGEASALLESVVATGDQDPALLHNLGLALYFQHRFSECRSYFSEAMDRGLTAPSNTAYLARALHQLGETPQAIDVCKRWVKSEPSATSMGYLALLLLDDGDLRAANHFAKEALASDRSSIDANIVAGTASLAKYQSDQARSHFETVLQHDPENGRAHFGLGLVSLHDQEIPTAIESLSNAVRAYPGDAGMVATLGWAQTIGSDFASAEDRFTAALQIDREFADPHAGLAVTAALQGKFDRAREQIETAERLDPNGASVQLAQAIVLAAHGDQARAVEAFDALLKSTSHSGGVPLIEHLRIYSTKKQAILARKSTGA